MNLQGKSFHILGICGIGMSAIARYLKSIGCNVSGSDKAFDSEMANNLRSEGIKVLESSLENITNDLCFIVKSTAISSNDKEIIKACELGIKVLSRSDILSEITRKHNFVISISGSHGKTTTTTMTGELLYYLGTNPTVFSGGIMGLFNSNFRLGSEELMVVEADESDGTFINLKSDIAVLTNIEFEHAEYYKDIDHLIESCETFTNGDTVQSVVVYGDDPLINSLKINKKTIRYGFGSSNDIYAKDLSDTITIVAYGKEIKDVKLNCYGKHNILNALCALSIAIAKYGLTDNVIAAGRKMMESFKGVARRFNILPNNKGVTIIDDYGHHPSEIRATVATAVQLNGRVIAVLQPHRYSRVAALFNDFITCLSDADIAIISNIYPGGEEEISGISGKRLAELTQEKFPHKEIYFREDKDAVYQILDRIRQPQDIIVFMGAGDVTEWAKNYAAN
jgi:UDP-N-acetylmuramate--alanine ligase